MTINFFLLFFNLHSLKLLTLFILKVNMRNWEWGYCQAWLLRCYWEAVTAPVAAEANYFWIPFKSCWKKCLFHTAFIQCVDFWKLFVVSIKTNKNTKLICFQGPPLNVPPTQQNGYNYYGKGQAASSDYYTNNYY